MNGNGEVLRSVNWTTGMLLTPQHFERQDARLDASFSWLLRYCIPGAGLVGGGVRTAAAYRGKGKFDPQLEVADEGDTVSVTVLQARGITPAGDAVEVGEDNVVRGRFAKDQLAGKTEILVHVVHTGEREEDPETVGVDEANPTQAALRRPRYTVSLGASADVAHRSVVVGKLRRASESTAFERDRQFIPQCVTVLAHSELYNGWSKLQADVLQLAAQYAELHRRVARYVDYISKRGIDVLADHDVLSFVERAVLALDTCAYETFDPTMSPFDLFQQVERAARRIAIALDLSESTRLFFRTLSGADASYGALLEEERQALTSGRQLALRDDLRFALSSADETLTRLRRLADALDGKYVDYRINRSLDSLRFLIDAAGEGFYVAVATPDHPQRAGDLLTFVFSQLSLPGQQEYRLIFLGDPQGVSKWEVGDELQVDLRVNSASGGGKPIDAKVACEIPEQRNFALNFEAPPEVATISGLHVSVRPGHRVRGAILYQRKLSLTGGDSQVPLFHAVPIPTAEERKFDAAAAAPPPEPPREAPAPERPRQTRIKIRRPGE